MSEYDSKGNFSNEGEKQKELGYFSNYCGHIIGTLKFCVIGRQLVMKKLIIIIGMNFVRAKICRG